jgi:uncharacterized integral membrane protein
MRSYILAIAVSMLLAAVYAFQNTSEIAVRFLMFERLLPQGVWEIILFSLGAVIMWFFSILASVEIHSAHRSQVNERDKKIAALEEEKSSLLNAFKYLPQSVMVAGHDGQGVAVSAAEAREEVTEAAGREASNGEADARRSEAEADLPVEGRGAEEEKESVSV